MACATSPRLALAASGAAVLAAAALAGCGSPAPSVLPAGTSTGTIHWSLPGQSSCSEGFTESFTGQIAGRALSGTVTVPAPSGRDTCGVPTPGTVFAGSLGGTPFKITATGSGTRTGSGTGFTGQIGGLAVHGSSLRFAGGPPGLGYPESIVSLTGSLGAEKVTIRYTWAAPTPADPDTPGVSGQSVTTVATVTVTGG